VVFQVQFLHLEEMVRNIYVHLILATSMYECIYVSFITVLMDVQGPAIKFIFTVPLSRLELLASQVDAGLPVHVKIMQIRTVFCTILIYNLHSLYSVKTYTQVR